ncbi:MAG: hypothetical protein P8X96_01340 [Desulfobacteraceae bacterium]|jgi:uncharacterized coiled-coil protein SlyX
MNGQLIELWGRWMTNMMRNQNYLDIMGGWWLRGMRDMSTIGQPYTMLWGMPPARQEQYGTFDGWLKIWESLSGFQQLIMQWAQMVPQHKYGQLERRAEELEAKLREQAKTIDRLRNLLRKSKPGGENNVMITQLEELIGQQSEQFKQMTQSVSDYLKSSAEKVSAKK